jgi:hypothetical protein
MVVFELQITDNILLLTNALLLAIMKKGEGVSCFGTLPTNY